MPDFTGKYCRETGEILAPPAQYPTLPAGKLADQTAKEKLVKETEKLIAAELYAGPGLILRPASAAQKIQAGSPLHAAAEDSLGKLGANVSAGIAMRYYAGFFEMAKSLRYDENTDTGGRNVIDDVRRGAYLADIHCNALRDPVYAAGAQFGWWGIKRPDRTQEVFDNGISAFFKQEYLADYYRRYPPTSASTS